ncbi:MAG: cation:proton antiporter, partial [Cyanobacteria bacterium J06553_1]
MEFSLLTFQTTVLGLLLVACLSAIALRKLHFPYTIGLVIIGLALGFGAEAIPGLEMLTDLNLSHEAILFLFLPPLIFESALNLNARLLLRNITPVLVLATAGLLMATAVVSALMAWLTPLSWHESLLFGALISATDPVAVIALFKELGVPNQLVVLVEGESLFNDATAIVTFNLILAAAAMETENLAVAGLTEF